MKSQSNTIEEYPLLGSKDSKAYSNDLKSSLKLLETFENKPGDKYCYIGFVLLVFLAIGFGVAAIALGDINALVVGIDDNGNVCGSYRRPYLSSPKSAYADLTWSKYLLASPTGNPAAPMAKKCVDSCPAKRTWLCASNVALLTPNNGTTKPPLNCSSLASISNSTQQAQPFFALNYAPVYGFCVSDNGTDISRLLSWIASQLSARQFGLIINYDYLLAALVSVVIIAVLANVVLGVLLHCNFNWNMWLLFIIFAYVATVTTFGVVLSVDVYGLTKRLKNYSASPNNGTVASNNQTRNMTPIDVPSSFSTTDEATVWLLLSMVLIIAIPVTIILWSVVKRASMACLAVQQWLNQSLVSPSTLTRLHVLTIFYTIVLIIFHLVMLLIVYYISAVLDEAFGIGIFAPAGSETSDAKRAAVAFLMLLWTIVWIVLTEALVALHYGNISAHVWYHFFESNFYFPQPTFRDERSRDMRACFLGGAYQFGVSLHGAFWLFGRLSRVISFALTTVLFNRPSPPMPGKMSEAIYSIGTFFSGIGFKRAAAIYQQLLAVEDAAVAEQADNMSIVTTLTNSSNLDEPRDTARFTRPSLPDHRGKLEVAERELVGVQNNITELEKKIAELARLEGEQNVKKTQLKVIRDLTATKEKNLSDKETQVRYLLNTLLAEFQKTKKELGEALDRQRIFEIKKMTNPPDPVKLTIEAVAFLIGEKELDWASLRVFIVKDSFLPSLLRLDGDTVKIEACRAVRDKYFSNKAFTYDRTVHASKTCAILWRWLDALTAFALERDRIKPMLLEIDKLSSEVARLRAEDIELKNQVAQQDAMIAGTRLQAQALKKQLSRMRGQEKSLNANKTNIEKLVEETSNKEPPSPMVVFEKLEQDTLALLIEQDKERLLREKIMVTRRIEYLIWVVSCFCYAIALALCILSFPVVRALLSAFVPAAAQREMALLGLPCFYAFPMALAFCLVFSVTSTVLGTFESLFHTCAVASLLYINGEPATINPETGTRKFSKLPPAIDTFVAIILRQPDQDFNNISEQ